MLGAILVLFAVFGPINCMTVPEARDNEDIPTKNEVVFSTHYLSSLDHKIDAIVSTITAADTSIKQLQEKAHTWAIFRHHIDSWNDQMKVLEHKIDLIRRTQDENQLINQKLTSQEFILNHILSKVVYLSDSCGNCDSESTTPRARDNSFAEIKKILNNDRKTRTEIGTRLSNILRHVQNIETETCRKAKSGPERANKIEKLVLPLNTCNGTRPNEEIGQLLKEIEKHINKISGSIPQKELKQINSAAQSNAKKIDEMIDHMEKIDDRTIRLYDSEGENHVKLTTLCQSISNEITTFTGSSDLLLKKIERLVQDVQAKVEELIEKKKITSDRRDVESSHFNSSRLDYDEVIGNRTMTTTEDADDVNIDDDSDTPLPPLDLDFVQTNKMGCHELTTRFDGIYKFSTPELNEAGRDINERYCVFSTDGPAWTVIQNRGPYMVQENFNRTWDEYRDGFGDLAKDFWFGNEFIHQLTYYENYELRVELEDFEQVLAWAEYSIFRLDNEKYHYNLLIGGFRGAIPDAMKYHNGQEFSTYDRRNDKSVDACCACASGYASGWWFDNCTEANLNGVFHDTPLGHNYVGIIWEQWHGDYSLKSTKMMIRPRAWPTDNKADDTNGDDSLKDP